MRLGQLARKLAMRPTEIVEFLGENQILIDEGPNTRLENEHVALILQKFGAEEEDAQVSEEGAEAVQENSEPEPDQAFEVVPEVSGEEVIFPESESIQKVEVIKVPKIELSGLKVIGKIDLPEERKTVIQHEPESSPDAPQAEKPMLNPRKNLGRERKQHNLRQRKNPIAIQREKEAEDLHRKKEEIAAKEKEKRTRNYLKKVKVSQPTKPVRLVNEPLMEMSAAELEEAPRTWYGKLMRWLTKA